MSLLCRRGVNQICGVFGLIGASLSCSAATPGGGDLSDFVVNIARYTTWPASASRKEVTACYAHGGALQTNSIAVEQSYTLKSQPVVWRHVTAPSQVAGCSLLWLNADVRPAPREWLAAVADQPVLTLSNYADFTADGGIIGAYRVGGDWRFEVSLEALQRSRLTIAAAALRLSQRPRPPTATTAPGESR
ncbi:MAG: YfiR family protein [Burkholderiales bacterium]|nr:YfiR family protein [Burkholderiales bacterium]